MTRLVILLGLVAGGLGSLVAIGAAVRSLWRFGRQLAAGVRQLARGIATLAALPAAVEDLSDALRELRAALTVHADQLDDHERRITAVETTLTPSEV